MCQGQCTDLQTDNNNCGNCGTVCPPGQSCQNGVCNTASCQMAVYNPSICMNPTFRYYCPGAPANCECFAGPIACASITQACPAPNNCVACNMCGRTYDCSLPSGSACQH
jgi:hypothetical protein